MGAYESVENYAKFTHMSLEQAKIRYEHFIAIGKQMHDSKRCPKCQQYTLEYEGGEWESGIKAYVYCENDKIKTTDEDGDTFYEECEFADDVKPEYLFAVEADFDVVLYMACSIENEGLEKIEKQIGYSWQDFVEKENASLLQVN